MELRPEEEGIKTQVPVEPNLPLLTGWNFDLKKKGLRPNRTSTCVGLVGLGWNFDLKKKGLRHILQIVLTRTVKGWNFDLKKKGLRRLASCQ